MKARPSIVILTLAALISCLAFVNLALSAEGYPHREKYSDIAIISTEDLKEKYDDVVIIDVRSQVEFDVVRIKKAIHIPISSRNFEKMLNEQQFSREESKKSIVFYCNGHSCEKSYQAAQKSNNSGFNNVLCYDGGIFDWIEAYPELSLLMGKTISSRNKVIPSSEHQARVISLQEFQAKAGNSDVIVIDIRDSFQRKYMPAPDIKGIINAPIDNLAKLIESRKHAHSALRADFKTSPLD